MKLPPFVFGSLLLTSSLFGRLPSDNAALPVVPLWPADLTAAAVKAKGLEHVRVSEAGEHVVSNVHQPSLTIVVPDADRATGAGVVICPGGGHRELWMDHEGYNVARWLADHGIAAFILKYRLAREEGSTYRLMTESLGDAHRAFELLREHAAEWQVDPSRVGIVGFSAGGELAALAAAGAPSANRPAFQALLYPGYVNSIEILKNSPPAFLACGDSDSITPPELLVQAYLRFHDAGVPAELHIFNGAAHGFGVRPTDHSPASKWLERFHDWLGARGFLAAAH